MFEFKMPSLGADMTSGTVYSWLVKPGDRVARGDIVAEVETDKGVIDIEVFEDGVIHDILVEEGTEMPVGAVLALIRTDEAEPVAEVAAADRKVETAPAEPAASHEPHPMDHHAVLAKMARPTAASRVRVSPLARKRAQTLGVALEQVTGTGRDGAVTAEDVERFAAAQHATTPKITPVAKRVAEELAVDLSDVSGTGPHGSICKKDVERAAAAQTPVSSTKLEKRPAASARTSAPEAMRQAIARAMARANREIPHYYLESQINMARPLRWLEQENLRRPMKERLLPAVVWIQAIARALMDVPQLNGFWRDDQVELQPHVHLGFAIALRQGGLMTPAIHRADMLSLDELMVKLRDLIARTRAGRLRGSELTDATVTVTSLGDLGVEKVYGVIYPPQIALIGLGKIMERPWAENGMLGVRPVMTATVAGDHRASDGLVGARFLEALNRHLQEDYNN